MFREGLRASLLLTSAALLGAAGHRCIEEPPASQEARDLITLLDSDGDGRVSVVEYDRVSDGELGMSYLDANASGWLEPWEVDTIIRYISPLRASMSWVPRAL